MTFDADNLRTLKKRIGSSLFPFYRRALAREGALAELNNELCASFLYGPKWCVEDAARYGVVSKVHPNDFIFQYLLRVWKNGVRGAVSEYFDTGHMSANKLRAILFNDLGLESRPVRLLEFASGYGCVSRHLVNFSDEIELTACDIHNEARQFYADNFSVPFIMSASVPENFDPSAAFDAVFALSFFSHMPEASWSRWLNRLFDCVVPGGFLIFTTHGIVSMGGMRGFSNNGFRFRPDSEQKDLATAEYGTTFTTPTFVRSEIDKISTAKLFLFREGEWWGHQDLYVVKKIAAKS